MAPVSTSQISLGEYLLREGFITQSDLNRALEEQKTHSRSLGRILVEQGKIQESMRMSVLQKVFGFKLIRIKDREVNKMVLGTIPYAFAEKHRVVPIEQAHGKLLVAMEDPSDVLVLDMIKNKVGMPVIACVASHEEIQTVLNQYESQAQEKEEKRRGSVRERLWYRTLKKSSFPILTVLPILVGIILLKLDVGGIQLSLTTELQGGTTQMDLAIYIMLIWGLWAIALFWLNGVIFGEDKEEDTV
jgi:hypothetical protein